MRLAELTTLRVGGEAASVLAPTTRDELIDAVRAVWASGEDLLLLGGGSNVLIGDGDFDGTVVRVATRGIELLPSVPGPGAGSGAAGTVRLRVQAGEPWDALVAHTVERGWSGIEALSGIPGSTGAAPIQNIGAYGQEIGDNLVAIEFLDYLSGEVERIEASALELGYRTSALKRGREGLVISVELELVADAAGLGSPVAYPQLATALGVAPGDRVPVAEVRASVQRLRAGKGMLLDPLDPDSVSAGSFFTNPIVDENFARGLPADAPRWPVTPDPEPVARPLDEAFATELVVAEPAARDYSVKLSAAWLIEHAGIGRGFRLPGSRAAVSSKHTLALVNTGGATADEIAQLAGYIQTRVMADFGVRLHPEPVFVGVHAG